MLLRRRLDKLLVFVMIPSRKWSGTLRASISYPTLSPLPFAPSTSLELRRRRRGENSFPYRIGINYPTISRALESYCEILWQVKRNRDGGNYTISRESSPSERNYICSSNRYPTNFIRNYMNHGLAIDLAIDLLSSYKLIESLWDGMFGKIKRHEGG